MSTIPAYAIGYLRDVRFGDDIIGYLERIDESFAPFGGEFLVHGGAMSPREGEWDGDIIIIRFPSSSAANRWYDCPAYQEILPLRTDNSEGIVTIVEGVLPGHRGVDKVAELLGSDAHA